MANHCHRDRRSLSIRPGKRSRFVRNAPSPQLIGPDARMHATAKNPERSNSSRTVRSFMRELRNATERPCTPGRDGNASGPSPRVGKPREKESRGNQGDATESWNPRCAYVFVGQSFADFRRVRAEIFWKDPSGSERARFPLITAGNGTILSCKMQEDSGLSLFCARSPTIRVHQECPKQAAPTRVTCARRTPPSPPGARA